LEEFAGLTPTPYALKLSGSRYVLCENKVSV